VNESNKIKVKVVVVAMFERGTPDDGNPGELELWVQNEKLDKRITFPVGHFDLRMNDDGLLAVLTGMGPVNAATIVTALGSDPRFDLSKAYWIVAGIAGVDPNDASIGSAAWAEYVVDGDIMHELDSREVPEGWPYGKLSLSASEPNKRKSHVLDSDIAFKLNKGLVDWAYNLTKDLPLPDYPELAEYRDQFKGYPMAVLPPFVLKGDSLGTGSYWHGDTLNKWANDWVRMYTEGKGNFVMANMEDNGTAKALKHLSKAGLVDFNRLLVLRTASNYSTPPPGQDAQWHFTAPFVLNGMPSIEAAYKLGSIVVHEIIKNWDENEEKIPE
jgi:purine nucleoside permease